MILVSKRKDAVFSGQRRVAVFFDKDEDKVNGPSRNRVKPEFYKETQIDVIMRRAMQSGLAPVKPNPRYGDFSNGADLMETQNRIIDLHRYFDSLPSETRDFFDNKPANYLDFLADPKNKEKAIEMGLLNKPKENILYTDESGKPLAPKAESEKPADEQAKP